MNWQRTFLRLKTGKQSTSLRELYEACSDEERRFSREFFERYPTGRGVGTLTAFEGIRQDSGPLAFAPEIAGSASGDLPQALEAELSGPREADVAVSGGIDSWVLAALLKRLGCSVRGWYLESRVEGYCEREQVDRFEDALGIRCERVRVTADDFVAAAEDFVAVTETPIYNLHPVSKLLLARGLARNGVTSIVTGDGADQVMRRDWDCDLLPLTLTCLRAAGIRPILPFLSPRVISLCPVDPNKQLIRSLATRLGIPNVPKHASWFPDVGQVSNLRPISNRPLRALSGQSSPVAPAPRRAASALVPASGPLVSMESHPTTLAYTTHLLLQTLDSRCESKPFFNFFQPS